MLNVSIWYRNCHITNKNVRFYKDVSVSVWKCFHTLNYDLRRKKNKNVITMKKDERGGKIIIKFETTTPKTQRYKFQTNDQEIKDSESIKVKIVKKICV